jgi:hypothetical protein
MVKVSLLHQTNQAVLSKWWYKQQNYDPFVSCWDLPQSAKAASKATAEMQASADSNKMPSIFQLIVGSKQMYRRKPQQDLVDSSSLKTIIFETSDAFSRWLIVTFIKPNANFPLSKSSLQSAPNSLSREMTSLLLCRNRGLTMNLFPMKTSSWLSIQNQF